MLPEWWLSNSGQVAQWEPEYSVIERKYKKLRNSRMFNFFDSSRALLKLIKITALISEGKVADGYCEFKKIVYAQKREIDKCWENDYR